MSNVVGLGVVGAGAIGINAALKHMTMDDVQDRVRIAAICDVTPGRAEAAAKEYGVDAHYTDLDSLLNDKNVDAVTIGTPIGLHFEQGMAAIEAGKHVHFNKTMTTTVEDADKLIERAKEKNVRIVASPGMMLHPHNRRLRKLIQEGALGDLIWAAAQNSISHYHTNEKVRRGDGVLGNIDPTWYYKKPGGGPLYDTTVYILHSLTGLLGPAKRVTAMSGLVVKEREYRGKKIECEMDDSTFFLLDFGNAFHAFSGGTVLGGVCQGFGPSIFGTQGTIKGTQFIPKQDGGGSMTFGGEGESRNLKLPEDHMPHVNEAHGAMAESHVWEDMMQLVDWIREDKASEVTAEHARHVIDIFESAYRSAETGSVQELRTSFDPIDVMD